MEDKSTDKNVLQYVESLLQKMTLDQKIGQMTQTERMVITPEEVKTYHIGSVLSGGGSVPKSNRPADWIEMNDAYWSASMEADEHHLAIPIIYGVDAVHGHSNVIGATIFPHNIGLGAANDPELIERIAKVTAREILSTGVEWTFAPTLAVARNNQWGRTYESYSEDPAIVQSYSGRFVKGLQGELGKDSVVGCVKHWVGDGGTSYGIDQGDTEISDDEMSRIHIAPYYPALAEGVLTVMASFNSWNGKKCHGHRYLLTDVLKNELEFKGFIISDWDGIDYLDYNYEEAVALSTNAGIDMFMVSEKWREFIAHLKNHVNSGRVPMERIDDAVRRILYVKVKYGLFDKPRPAERFWSKNPSFGTKENRTVAQEAVRKSLVLLKNENSILPLSKNAQIIVAGKNADDCGHQCGGFTVAWQGVSDSLSMNRDKEDGSITMDYNSPDARVQKGTIEGGTSIWDGIKSVAPNAILNINGSAADSEKHDVGIVVIGETPYAEGMGDIRNGDHIIEETAGKTEGFMKVLHPYAHSLVLNEIHPEDLRAIKNITDQGIPAVVVLVSGRTLIIKKELKESSAFVAAWLPGSEGGGVADVLFGDFDFQGKLSFTWQKEPGENFLKGDENYDPLFAFGHGLDYSREA
ncbi:MAG: glycoside hydrolase family 3 protein [Saprospiraceae bacterium]